MSEPRPPEGPANPPPGGSSRLVPILLIVAGVALLLGRLGVFDWSVALAVLELWPVLLVAIGVDVLTRGRYRLPVVLGAVVAAVALSSVPGVGGGPAETHQVAYDRGPARAAEVELEHGIGELRLEALPARSERLVAGEIATGRGERLVREFAIEDGVAEVRFASRRAGFAFGGGGGERAWRLGLSPDLPIALAIDAGVGDSRLDLRDLELSAFELDSGVGDVTVTLPERGGYAASIDAGVGEVRVRIPHGVEARVEADAGVGGVDVTGAWARDGDVHATLGYAAAPAERRITLRVDGGVGRITVERID